MVQSSTRPLEKDSAATTCNHALQTMHPKVRCCMNAEAPATHVGCRRQARMPAESMGLTISDGISPRPCC